MINESGLAPVKLAPEKVELLWSSVLAMDNQSI
jgi:hypothetical protein